MVRRSPTGVCQCSRVLASPRNPRSSRLATSTPSSTPPSPASSMSSCSWQLPGQPPSHHSRSPWMVEMARPWAVWVWRLASYTTFWLAQPRGRCTRVASPSTTTASPAAAISASHSRRSSRLVMKLPSGWQYPTAASGPSSRSRLSPTSVLEIPTARPARRYDSPSRMTAATASRRTSSDSGGVPPCPGRRAGCGWARRSASQARACAGSEERGQYDKGTRPPGRLENLAYGLVPVNVRTHRASRTPWLENRTVSGQAAAPGAAQRSRVRWWICGCGRLAGSGGGLLGWGLEDDLLAGEVFELADEVTLAASLVDLGRVEVGAEISVVGLRVGEQVPDDGEHRVAHRDDRAFLAAASGQAPVALAKEGVGACQRGDDLAEGCGQPGVAPPGGAAFLGAGGLVVDGGELRPGDQVRGGGKAAHLDADLGDQLLGGDHPDPGDLIQPLGVAGKRGDRPVDLGGDLVELGGGGGGGGGGGVDALQHQLAQEAVVVVEVAAQCLLQDRDLGPHAGAGQLGERLGVALASDERLEHLASRHPKMSLITLESLIWASSRSCSTRCFSRVRSRVRLRR